VDGPFLDRFIDEGKCLGKKLLGRFPVLVFDRLSQFFDLRAKNRFVAPVYRVPAEAVSPLALRRFVMSHVFLLYGTRILRYLPFSVNSFNKAMRFLIITVLEM
jgi:hypothetical protein